MCNFDKKLRVFHSFWSKPLLQKRFGQTVEKQMVSTLLFSAIGVVAAKRLGIEIVLHTDTYGAKLFERLPYDDVYLTLEGHDINSQFWASGKMLALEREPIGSVHLDLDAWIKFPKCRDILSDSHAHLVAQSFEESSDVYNGIKEFVFNNINEPDFINLKTANNFRAYNCGLVKINDYRLKDMWLDAYWKITKQLDSKLPHGILDKYCIPDLISEQWLLYQLCAQQNFSVELICDGWANQERAKEIGFTHLISEQKYHIDDELKKVLSKLNNALLSDILNNIDNLEAEN